MRSIEEVLNNIDKNWSNDELIRYLYRALAPFFHKDLNFFKLKSKEYKYYLSNTDKYMNPYRISDEQEEYLVICKSLANYYYNIFISFNIECEIVITNFDKPEDCLSTDLDILPHYALLVHGDKGWYYIDPHKDLMANQILLRTNHFGIIPNEHFTNKTNHQLVELDDSYLNELDEKLGFSNHHLADSFDKLNKLLHTDNKEGRQYLTWNKFLDREDAGDYNILMAKLELMKQLLINIGNAKGPIERLSYYRFILNTIFTPYEQQIVNAWLEEGKVKLEINCNIYVEETENNGLYKLKHKGWRL